MSKIQKDRFLFSLFMSTLIAFAAVVVISAVAAVNIDDSAVNRDGKFLYFADGSRQSYGSVLASVVTISGVIVLPIYALTVGVLFAFKGALRKDRITTGQ